MAATTLAGQKGHLVRSGTTMLGIAAAAIALACACSSNTPGTPQPTNTGHTPPTSSNLAEPGGAPKVKNPLDTTKWQHDPCSVIPAATLSQLGVTTSGQVQHGRPGCYWEHDSEGAAFTVQYVTDAPHGLSTIYLDRSNTTRFQPFTIEGYPALTYQTKHGTNPTQDCDVAVGVTDKLYFDASVGGLESGGPCSVAKTLANDAMATMAASR